MKDIKPLGDRILVKKLEVAKKSSPIIIPDTVREKPQTGEVVAVGTGKVDKSGNRIPLAVKKGDKVLFAKYAGDDWKMGNEEYLFLTEDEVLAIL